MSIYGRSRAREGGFGMQTNIEIDYGAWKSFERATPKVKFKATDVRVLFAREIFTRFFAIAKFLKGLVARDGIEPPTPAFSGPPTEWPKWFEINGCY